MGPPGSGKTKSTLHDRKTEHLKPSMSNNHSSATYHVMSTGHNMKWHHFEILALFYIQISVVIQLLLLKMYVRA